MTVQNYRDLIVWQKSMDLVQLIYESTAGFPKEEIYGLSSQIRRAAISIPSNIAEGQARSSTLEFKRFLSIAQGSRAETETQVLIANRLGYLNDETANRILALSDEIKRMIHGLVNRLREKS